MIKHPDETPATYVNKGQAYYLSVADTSATALFVQDTRYRTFACISSEDDQQRQ
jgi:hypothetical protein